MKQDTLRNSLGGVGSPWSGRSLTVSILIVIALYLAGCTASWRAPVESRAKRTPPKAPRTVISTAEYRVQRGDTLYGIAWQSGIDYRLIAAWNGVRPPYRIYPGQTLRMKPPPAARNPPPRSPPAAKTRPRAVPAAKPAPSRPVQPAVLPKRLHWTWPAQGPVVARFNASDPSRKGIKIGGRAGNVIRAAERGKVVYSGSRLIGYGRLIIVKHNDNYLSAYGHNRKILVKEGDQVTKGQKIAEMGSANSGDSLLHFEIRRDGKPVDPLRLLPRR